jgi:hypothetical protein
MVLEAGKPKITVLVRAFLLPIIWQKSQQASMS